MLRVGLDVDEILADWWNPYVKRFGLPQTDFEITRHCNYELAKDRNFWLTLPVLRRPIGFEPELYCTKRSCLKSYTKDWLKLNNFPKKPVYQVYTQKENKARYVKGRVDVFVDDSPFNFLTMNMAGVPCLLMDTPANQHLGPILRIDTLDYEEISDVYYLALEMGIFKEFNKYFDC